MKEPCNSEVNELTISWASLLLLKMVHVADKDETSILSFLDGFSDF